MEEEKAVVEAYAAHTLAASRERMAKERVWIQLKNDALAALPDDLRAAAEIVDSTPFPPSRRIPLDTPPHPDFDAVLNAENEDV